MKADGRSRQTLFITSSSSPQLFITSSSSPQLFITPSSSALHLRLCHVFNLIIMESIIEDIIMEEMIMDRTANYTRGEANKCLSLLRQETLQGPIKTSYSCTYGSCTAILMFSRMELASQASAESHIDFLAEHVATPYFIGFSRSGDGDLDRTNIFASLMSCELAPRSIKGKEFGILVEALKANSTLTTLDLLGNSIGDNGAQALSKALKTNSMVTISGVVITK
ncbi:hypothetical protein K457DRAFT_26132 [Linnemannia elongata AG-77]|uniref:RNI-like protein n=1 Tax=Linnemannia elongata AG-77 TaxID=1314771 RepID=A0A197JBF2_9FUNG|nr:hypothetical protein K457DRAFT_26132 [Linnemannia elongata AG-77]